PKPEDPKPGPQTEKKGDSGGCDAGLLSFAALALVPMASRFGKKAR
ncbi:MAG: Synerg-CTERM sorting domain-containing protein, partial [Fretibacterium sp.]